MYTEFLEDLKNNGNDINGALLRLSGNDEMLVMVLKEFIHDTTMAEMKNAIDEKLWDDAFTAAHALKGLAGNLGLTTLFHSLGELVIAIRAGRMDRIDSSYENVKHDYDEVVLIIKSHRE